MSRCHGFNLKNVTWSIVFSVKTVKLIHNFSFSYFFPQIQNPSTYSIQEGKQNPFTSLSQAFNSISLAERSPPFISPKLLLWTISTHNLSHPFHLCIFRRNSKARGKSWSCVVYIKIYIYVYVVMINDLV